MARRFSIFLFGILLGVMIIRFAFPGRFSEYMQYFNLDYRVIYHLNQDTIYVNSNTQCLLECFEMQQSEIVDVLNGGEVNFDKSKVNEEPCKFYFVEKDALSVQFELCTENVVKIIDFNLAGGKDSCSCD